MEADSVSLTSVLWYFKHASFFLLFLELLEIVLSNVAQNGQCAVLNMWTAKDAQMEQMNRTLNGLGGEKRGWEEKERGRNLKDTLNESSLNDSMISSSSSKEIRSKNGDNSKARASKHSPQKNAFKRKKQKQKKQIYLVLPLHHNESLLLVQQDYGASAEQPLSAAVCPCYQNRHVHKALPRKDELLRHHILQNVEQKTEWSEPHQLQRAPLLHCHCLLPREAALGTGGDTFSDAGSSAACCAGNECDGTDQPFNVHRKAPHLPIVGCCPKRIRVLFQVVCGRSGNDHGVWSAGGGGGEAKGAVQKSVRCGVLQGKCTRSGCKHLQLMSHSAVSAGRNLYSQLLSLFFVVGKIGRIRELCDVEQEGEWTINVSEDCIRKSKMI
ncbi:uncharacterized protein MONOS_8148 [Monocercomonoides exilis]|uniref:uncharacterized protein n=1 Tax=Monocercomonoides exilis TaxID=2049356 RepID=UPI00355AADA4|nr:hypothetical protein MONOS_8148 [Monocercomonoides exilis]|eukprot:MONOS_8148.1-p1 / transcript=MONOS_8148.1 / gene=MONOS_8148 / organism=Monocercomonoides_exilis_PA203 / gene_product=unspecified product / transcript_product=unspecified product / location=Mono_scaffold00298:49417-50700(-) / protein_length=383 / sequence_SO=supercontig / SO=protein_coding / is_pseudo=false